jgi:hypothetical protein
MNWEFDSESFMSHEQKKSNCDLSHPSNLEKLWL